jgi:hypothetical protein
MPNIEMPDGNVVNFPDNMPDEQIKNLISSKFPKVAEKDYFLPQDVGVKENLARQSYQGLTVGFGDLTATTYT